MKKNLVGYIEPKRVVEVVALVDENRLKNFFDRIKDYNFETGYQTGLISSDANTEKKVLPSELPQSSKEVIDILKKISEQEFINFSELNNLLESDSKMNNPETIKVFDRFLRLYDFERKRTYERAKYCSIRKAVFLLGSKKDKEDFETLANSLMSNTRFLNKLGRHTLLDIDFGSMSIDKQLIR